MSAVRLQITLFPKDAKVGLDRVKLSEALLRLLKEQALFELDQDVETVNVRLFNPDEDGELEVVQKELVQIKRQLEIAQAEIKLLTVIPIVVADSS